MGVRVHRNRRTHHPETRAGGLGVRPEGQAYIPRSRISSVEAIDRSEVPSTEGAWLRAPGTHVPGLIRYGSYGRVTIPRVLAGAPPEASRGGPRLRLGISPADPRRLRPGRPRRCNPRLSRCPDVSRWLTGARRPQLSSARERPG